MDLMRAVVMESVHQNVASQRLEGLRCDPVRVTRDMWHTGERSSAQSDLFHHASCDLANVLRQPFTAPHRV